MINCLENRGLRVKNGELLLEDTKEQKTLTVMPFQKILALFIIGHITMTTPLIEKCRKYGVFISVMKPNLRPIFTFGINAEANFMLREKQYWMDKEDISIPKIIVVNKIENQLRLLRNTRKKDILTNRAINACTQGLPLVDSANSLRDLMGLEGWVAKEFFKAYFQDLNWRSRMPRAKNDEINATLDIGYNILFNFIESYLRLFGFDLYRGIYHQLWFKRKSLVCDLMEPFRCIIDCQIRKSYNLGQFKNSDFRKVKSELFLKDDKGKEYYNIFYNSLIKYKIAIFKYTQSYYRCFMQSKKMTEYPKFIP